MAQTQAAGGPSEPDETAGGVSGSPDSSEFWPNGGMVGDGRYRITRRLGRGGMAEVFAAEDVRLGRTVAVKLMRSDLAEDPVAKARFTREAQSVAGLNHHAVVAVYDSGEDMVDGNAVPYIVMELVEGRTIRDLLVNADAPPPEQALIIVSGVLEALAYSHQHGIVHRDIKPANVIITDNGAVKVMDFGIARALHGASTTMTQTGMVMGTPQYLSPEQALGKTVDARSDLYATGCLLYELLALRPPFVGETPLSVVYQHVQDEPVPPSEVSDAVPPELDGLVMRALAKDPDDRFQTAEEMRGLVQYALRMLQEQGGHTGGLWNTGMVVSTGATPAMGTPAAYGQGGDAYAGATDATRVGPPLLMGNPTGGGPYDNGGAYDGNGGYDGGRGGGSGLKYALIAFFAVLAVGAGIFFAIQGSGDDKEPKTPSKTSSTPTDKETSPEPTEEEPTEEPLPNDPGTGGSGGWSDTGGPTDIPSDLQPTETPSPTDQPTEPIGGGQNGGQNGGTGEQDGGADIGGNPGGEQNGGTENGGNQGGNPGGNPAGGTDAGGAGEPQIGGNDGNPTGG